MRGSSRFRPVVIAGSTAAARARPAPWPGFQLISLPWTALLCKVLQSCSCEPCELSSRCTGTVNCRDSASDLAAVQAPDGERHEQHLPAHRPDETARRWCRLDDERLADTFGARAEHCSVEDWLELIYGSAPERVRRQQELADGPGVGDGGAAEYLTDRAGDAADPREKEEHEADDACRHPGEPCADRQGKRHH